MTDAVLLDTHIVLWLANGDAKLRPATREAIDRRWRAGGAVLVSAVTAWEIALLADAGRIGLGRPADEWVAQFLRRPGVQAAPLTWRAAASAYNLAALPHRDPTDRLLVATALDLDCDFATYDARLVAYAAGEGGRRGLRLLEQPDGEGGRTA